MEQSTELPDLWILTCAPGSRQEEAEFLFTMLGTPINRRVIVTTLPDPVDEDFPAERILFESEEINISKWWTLGLDFIASLYEDGDKWDVVLAETDVRISSHDIDVIRKTMRENSCIISGADWNHVTENGEHKVRRNNDEWKPRSRLPGVAYVIAGEAGIRHDPRIRWWYADDDFEWQSRVAGGSVLVSGTTLYHDGTQGPLTGFRAQARDEDIVYFREKWGAVPTEG